jgi:autotransporter-associated beta strand protein
MTVASSTVGKRVAKFSLTATACAAAFCCTAAPALAQQRALGLDISAWQGNISQTTWNNIRNVENRQFVFLRSSRGGTTGYDHLRGGYPANNNDAFTLSQRYDDPYFVQNINRATTAGIYAGAYHFGRMDIIASTPNTGGIPNNGADEANHFIQQAGPWMRPGYLLPVFDFEAGSAERPADELAQFAVDFSNRIHEVMGIRPAVYIGNNYASPMNSIPSVATAYPTLWTARWPNQADPNSIPVQTAHPGDYTPTVYGPWDNSPYPPHPWGFWQYASTGRLTSYNNGNSNLDFDVAQGDAEFLKDHLVPALWTSDNSGDWGALANWNSGQMPVAPPGDPNVQSCGTCPAGTTGQLAPIGAQTLPTPRRPGEGGSGVTSGQNDTVVLERPSANVTVALSSGNYNIRKLFVGEALSLTGGSLTINYVPEYDGNNNLVHYVGTDTAAWEAKRIVSAHTSARFGGAVTLSGTAALSVHTLQVDATQTFTLGGGSLTLDTIHLMPHASTPARIAMQGDIAFNPLNNAAAEIANGAGAGGSGLIDLGGAARVFNVANGAAANDLTVTVPIINGALTKNGAGTLALTGANSYLGDTTVLAGSLSVKNPNLADAAGVYISGSASLDLNFNGDDVVRSLYFNGVAQPDGIWGAIGSGAQFTSPLLTGTGRLHVTQTPPPPPPPGPGNVLDDFEIDEGHFGWIYSTSPSSQTFGLAGGPGSAAHPSDRVTTEHQGLGVASQLLNLVSDGSPNWQLRHNSGIGVVAQPAGNVQLAPTGYVGFWLKTDDPGITVRIAIDDPVGNTAIERGTIQNVVPDGQWHLYQWSFADPAQWDAFAGGADGDIDAANGYVTIDSIWFAGSGDAQIYLDTVSHNPLAMLAAQIPGDYDRNGVVDATDFNAWRAAYGNTVSPGSSADGNNDGQINGADYVVWRKASVSGGNGAMLNPHTSVPEPPMMLTAAMVLLMMSARSRAYPRTAGVWLNLRSLRSKLCLTPFRKAVLG